MRNIVLLLSICFLLSGCVASKNSNEKVLHTTVIAKIKGLDPIYSNDVYSSNQLSLVYEGLLQFHYLKRPYVLVPNLAESMPTVAKNGLQYIFKIRKGVYFHDDKSFKDGKGKELTASDFVYSIKRNADPKLQGNGWWLLDGKIKGLNEWRDKYSELEKVNYDEEVEGVRALDKYTLAFELTRPFPQFLYALAMSFNYVVAKEAVDHYGKEFINHPVGTGPFILKKFNPQSNRLVYRKNTNFREKLFPSEASEEFKHLLENAGKKLPFVDKVVAHVMVEAQPRWLKLMKGQIDYMALPKDNYSTAMTPGKEASPEMIEKGIDLIYKAGLNISYVAFNHTNKIFDNVYLRQAFAAVYDSQKDNELFESGLGLPAQSIIPPGVSGYEKDYVNEFFGDKIELAKSLLVKAGHPNGANLPEFTLDVASTTRARQFGEFFKSQLAQIGVNIKVITNPWPELQKKIKTKSTMLHSVGWLADYPDAENFLQLVYGPNSAPGANGSNFNDKEFNDLFEKAAVLQDSPERTEIYKTLKNRVNQLVPIIPGLHRMSFYLKQGWLKNFVLSEFPHGMEQYLDIDTEKRSELLKKF